MSNSAQNDALEELMKPTVGLIGLGLMGKPMGRNLLKAGFPLVVWNRTSAKADDLVREGAKLAANPRDVAAQVGRADHHRQRSSRARRSVCGLKEKNWRARWRCAPAAR